MNIITESVNWETRWLRLIATIYKDRLGKQRAWEWVERVGAKNAVSIVATTLNNRLVVIKEYRVPIKDYEWSLPAGLVDEGGTVLVTASRELKEETGLEIHSVSKVTPFIYNTAGLTSEASCLVYCTVMGKITKKNQEESEDIEVHLLTKQEVRGILKDEDKKFGAKAYLIMEHFAYSNGGI